MRSVSCPILYSAKRGKTLTNGGVFGRIKLRGEKMVTITEISVQKKDKNRVNVYADGRFLCGMQLTTVIDNGLKTGMTIEKQRLSEIQFESEKTSACEKALHYAESSPKTERQVREYLRKRGYMREIEDYAVEKLKEYKYVDDDSYAALYAESSKIKGKSLIKNQLYLKGIPRDSIERALEAVTEEDELASCRAAAEKYVRRKILDEKLRRKAYAYLRGKGFDGDAIKHVIASLFQGKEDEEE